MDAIQSKTLRTLILPVPSIAEQRLIFEKYRSLTKKIISEEKFLQKLVKNKNGLMIDLFLGKVPDNSNQKHRR